MKFRRKYWKAYLIGAAVLYLFVLARCHRIAPPLRRPDAVMEMKTTGYCACAECCSWRISWYGAPVNSKGKFKVIGKTSSGRMARPGTVAVDPKLFPMGTKFYISGYGWGIAQDTGGDIKGRHLDLFHWLHSSGEQWGVQTKQVKVWYPKR